MRADYGFYTVAIICFIIAALPYYYTNVIPKEILLLDSFSSTALTVIFAALGLISIILGYSQSPRPIISVPEAPKTALQSSPPTLPPTEETTVAQPSAPTLPTPPREETEKPERKKPKAKTRRKRTRKRRKKT